MPKVRRQNLPPALFQHLLARIQSRRIAATQLELLATWLDTEPDVPEGEWYKRFPGMTACGEGDLAGHLPGAISVPLGDLKEQFRKLPVARDIVAYCRGPYCVMALDAVDLLRREGFRAHRLELGVPEWRSRGWRVDTGGDHRPGGRP